MTNQQNNQEGNENPNAGQVGNEGQAPNTNANSDDDDDDDAGDNVGQDSNTNTNANDEVTKELQRVRQQAAKYRTERNADREKLTVLESQIQGIARALGVGGDGQKPDPDALSKQLANVQTELRQERMQNAFHKLATKHKADADLAWAYLNSSGRLSEIDDDSNYTEALEPLLVAALKERPKLLAEFVPNQSGGDPNGNQQKEGKTMNDLIRGFGR